MSTTTPRLGLTKPASSEAYDIAIPNANMDLLDAAPANVTICSSTTRPTTPDDGDLIYETDSNLILMRQSGSWKSFNNKIKLCTSSTRPASSLCVGGMLIFETDTARLYVRDSGNTSWLSTTTAFSVQVFTASGTWNMPAGLVSAQVEVVGGGGSGGGVASTGAGQNAHSGGGGGGGYARKMFAASALASSETVTVGAGGAAATAGNNAGNAGGQSQFAVGKAYVVTGNGGGGGTGSAATGANEISGATGGTATGGDINVQGDNGGHGIITSAPQSMKQNWGGGTVLAPRVNQIVNANTSGTAGRGYGGGSSGASNGVSAGAALASTAGAAGVVIVTHYFS